MKKLVLAMFTSLDGFIEGRDGFEPPPWSDQVRAAWSQYNLGHAAHLLYGRVNFEFNKQFWTSPAAAGLPETATMNRLPKTVVSRTLTGDPGWNGSLAQGDLSDVVAGLKRSTGDGDVYCFGGAGLARHLIDRDLVDEYRLMVTPKLLGGGKRLFETRLPAIGLELIDAHALDVGSVILHYRRQRQPAESGS